MIKSTIQLILWKHASDDQGHFPIWLKITVDRKTVYVSTGKFIAEKFWDKAGQIIKPGHHSAKAWNLEISKLKSDVSRTALDLAIEGKPITAAILKGLASHEVKYGTNIFKFIEALCKERNHKRRPGTIDNYQKIATKLKLYHGSDRLNFEDITREYLEAFDLHLAETVGNNYSNTIFKIIRTFFNSAIKKGLITHYPFKNFEMPAYKAPGKAYLTDAELARWERFTYCSNNTMRQAAVYSQLFSAVIYR